MRLKKSLLWWRSWRLKLWLLLCLTLILSGGCFFLVTTRRSVWLFPQEESLDWQKDLKLHLFEVEYVEPVTGNTLVVHLKDGVVAVFSPFKKREYQFDSLQFILKQSKINAKPVKRVDLRFDKPVVVYE